MRDAGTGRINIETTSSMITDSAVMIVVECPHLLRGVDHMCLGNMMKEALTMANEGY